MNVGQFKKGADNPRWNEGRTINGKGYVSIFRPDHPRADSKGYVYEHVLVMEAKLGRPLLPGEVVHHKDRIRSNNDPENLVLFASGAAHVRYHHWLRWLERQ